MDDSFYLFRPTNKSVYIDKELAEYIQAVLVICYGHPIIIDGDIRCHIMEN